MSEEKSVLKILELLGMGDAESFKNEIRDLVKEKVIEIITDCITPEIEQWSNYTFSRPDTDFFQACFEEAENKCKKQVISKYKDLLLNAEIKF